MNVWFCIPSARPAAAVEPLLQQWKEHGYRIALWRDPGAETVNLSDLTVCDPYPGYARAVNTLMQIVIDRDPEAAWLVTGGDDVQCHVGKQAQEIGEQCCRHFGPFDEAGTPWFAQSARRNCKHYGPTWGVMQPTGDRWGSRSDNAYIDRVAGSPWIGREFARRMYGGRGPLFEGYEHMFVDEELQFVATQLGVFWQRRDLIHLHQHWARKRGDRADMPAFLERWNTPEHWRTSKALFDARQAAGFPGHEPISASSSIEGGKQEVLSNQTENIPNNIPEAPHGR